MSHPTVIEILRKPTQAVEELRRRKVRLEQISAACQSTTAQYGGIGGGHSTCTGAKDSYSILSDAVTAVQEATETLIRSEKEAQDLLNTLLREDETFMERDYEVLRMRYILRLPWVHIQSALGSRGFQAAALRTVLRWHRRALKEAQDFMEGYDEKI